MFCSDKMAYASFSLVLIFLSLLFTVQAVCPDGWTRYDDHCLALFEGKYTWRDAGALCREFGGHLSSPNTTTKIENTKKFITYVNHKANVWLGGSDLVVPGVMSWDGDQKPIMVTDWGKGQPNVGSKEHCLGMSFSDHFKWHDYICSSVFDFLCERRP